MRAETGISSITRPVARIRNVYGDVVGAGFLVGENHVVTCAHVIDDALDRDRGSDTLPEAKVGFDLPFLDMNDLSGRVITWQPMLPLNSVERGKLSDIAVIEFDELNRGGLDPRKARLSPPDKGTGIQAYGFPEETGLAGTIAEGEISVLDAGGWYQVTDTRSRGYFVQPGFSGAAIIENGSERLLGMVAAADPDQSRNLAFVIPTLALCKAWPLLARPYKEMKPFEPEDTNQFFGRDEFVVDLERKVMQGPFTAVIGPSGSGKSSVVMAGLVPRLRAQGNWATIKLEPRRRPLLRLAHALVTLETENIPHSQRRSPTDLETQLRKDPGCIIDVVETLLDQLPKFQKLLLVVDQFEELFTLDDRESELSPSKRIDEFVEVLSAIGRQESGHASVHVVSTLRADFIGKALKNEKLRDLIQNAAVLLGPMNARELAEAITRPADCFSVDFAPGIVPEIVAQMARSPGGLPLMQFALAKLWPLQENRLLSYEAYNHIGKVEGALTTHAEDFLQSCSTHEQAQIQRIMLRLVNLSTSAEQLNDTRAVVLRSEMRNDDWPMILKLANTRLLMTNRDPISDEETVELVHEALIHAWPRLRDWIEQDREFGLWRQRLRVYLTDYDERKAVLTGSLLLEAELWFASHGNALNEAEKALIRESLDARKANLLAESVRQRIAIRRLFVLSSFLAVALVATVFFWKEARDSNLRSKDLLFQADIERARLLASTAENLLSEGDTNSALAVVVSAFPKTQRARWAELGKQSRANTVLSNALFRADLEATFRGHSESVRDVDFSPDGLRIATASEDGTARLWDIVSRKTLAEFRGHNATVFSVAFSPDGKRIVTSSWDKTARVWNAESGEQNLIIDGHDHPVLYAAFLPGDSQQRVVTSSADGTVRIWDSHSGQELRALPDQDALSTAVSPNGDWIATASSNGTTKLWNLSKNTPPITLIGHLAQINGVSFSSNGELIIASSDDGRVMVWDVNTGMLVKELSHQGGVGDAHLSAELQRVVTTSGNRAQLWDNRSNSLLRELQGHESTVHDVVFSQDGKRILTASSDNTARLWRSELLPQGIMLSGHQNFVNSAEFAPDGNQIVTASDDGTARIWDTGSGLEVRALRSKYGALNQAAFSPDGNHIVTASAEGIVQVWSAETKKTPLEMLGHEGSINSVEFSPDGEKLLTASRDGTARVWDFSARDQVRVLDLGNQDVNNAKFSRSGLEIVTASQDGIVRVWDSNSGSELMSITGNGGAIFTAAFSPDGSQVLTTSEDKTVRVWSRDNGQQVHSLLNDRDSLALNASYSKDGLKILVSSEDGRVRIINAGNYELINTIEAHSRSARDAEFSPDGRLIVTASDDMTVKLWSSESLSELIDRSWQRVEQADVLNVARKCRFYVQVKECPSQ